MDKFNLIKTANQILEQLSLHQVNEKKLREYRTIGFGNMIQYFENNDINDINLNMLDTYLQDMYLAHSSGDFSKWKWQLLRRSCELLKLFVTTGSVAMKPLRPWNYSRGKSTQSVVLDVPTYEQLNDPDNLFALIWKVRQTLIDYGFTESSIKHYTSEGLTVILRSHYEAGTETYSEKITDALVSAKRKHYEEGKTSRQSYQNLRKAAHLIKDIYENGSITLKKVPNWNLRIPGDEFAKVLNDFCYYLKKESRVYESSVPTIRSAVRRFLFGLEDDEIYSAQQLTPVTVNRCITKLVVNYPSGAGNFLYAVRLFLNYLFNEGITSANLSSALQETAAAKRSFHEPFTDSE